MTTRKCRYDGCPSPPRGLGYCPGHYRLVRLGQPLRPLAPRQRNKGKTCEGPDCERPAYTGGLCNSHKCQRERGVELFPIGSHRPGPDSKYVGVGCSFDGCPKWAVALGLCSGHNAQRRRGVALYPLGQRPPKPMVKCSEPECERLAKRRGYCDNHYRQVQRNGRTTQGRLMAGRFIDDNGYVMVKRPGHPESRKGGWGHEHRIVMSDILGRPLRKGENVHHVNGIRDDNRPENLELWDRAQLPGQRVSDRIKWMAEYLAQYGMAVVPAKREMPAA